MKIIFIQIPFPAWKPRPCPNSLSARIRSCDEDLSPTDRRLADLMLEYPGDTASYSASELARLTSVSNAAVSRFVQRLGFRNYEELRVLAREAKSWGLAALPDEPSHVGGRPRFRQCPSPGLCRQCQRHFPADRPRRHRRRGGSRRFRASGLAGRLPEQLLPGRISALAVRPGARRRPPAAGGGRDAGGIYGLFRAHRRGHNLRPAPPGEGDRPDHHGRPPDGLAASPISPTTA